MIFYFSGTGNTKWAAEYIANATHEKLIFIPDVLDGDFHFSVEADERIGFCFPVHGWRPPFIVRDFVRRLHIDHADGHYCYALATCGDDVGLTFDYFAKDLAVAGLKTDSVFSFIMPESYVGFPFMDVDNKQKRDTKKMAGAKILEVQTQTIVDRRSDISDINVSHWPWINSAVIGSYFLNKLVKDGPFHVEESRCVKCGICENVCPVGNIKGGLGYEPEWLHNGLCTTCFACYHHCPHHAIEFGKRTKNKGQYFFNKL